MEKMLWDLLAALPDPKLKSLNQMVVAMAVDSFGNQKNAAGYLGISQMKVSTMIREREDIRPVVSKRLWKEKTALQPGAVIEANSFKEASDILDEIKSFPGGVTTFTLTEKEQQLMDEGKIIVGKLNRNEL
jgi:hypothetical protein